MDDLVVAIVGLHLARRLIPLLLMDEYLQHARERNTPNSLPNAAFALLILGLFGLLTGLAAIIHLLRG